MTPFDVEHFRSLIGRCKQSLQRHDFVSLKRELHTIKGFGLLGVSESFLDAVHDLETFVSTCSVEHTDVIERCLSLITSLFFYPEQSHHLLSTLRDLIRPSSPVLVENEQSDDLYNNYVKLFRQALEQGRSDLAQEYLSTLSDLYPHADLRPLRQILEGGSQVDAVSDSISVSYSSLLEFYRKFEVFRSADYRLRSYLKFLHTFLDRFSVFFDKIGMLSSQDLSVVLPDILLNVRYLRELFFEYRSLVYPDSSLDISDLFYRFTKMVSMPFSYITFKLKALFTSLAGSGQELQLEGEDTLLGIEVIEPVYECLIHLVKNAIAHAQCRVLKVSCFSNSFFYTFVVEDDGVGVSKTLEELLSGGSSVSRVSLLAGRGVGLQAVYYQVVYRLQGRLSLTSTPGQGCCFRIVVPRSFVLVRCLVVSYFFQEVAVTYAAVKNVFVSDASVVVCTDSGQYPVQAVSSWDVQLPYYSFSGAGFVQTPLGSLVPCFSDFSEFAFPAVISCYCGFVFLTPSLLLFARASILGDLVQIPDFKYFFRFLSAFGFPRLLLIDLSFPLANHFLDFFLEHYRSFSSLTVFVVFEDELFLYRSRFPDLSFVSRLFDFQDVSLIRRHL